MDPHVLDLLVRELEITDEDVVQVQGLLDLASLWQLYDVDRPDLKDDPFVPSTHPRLAEGEKAADVFAALREGDVLVHHPYDSFATSVQRFVEQAAADPQVLAIKQTLYRTSGDSPVVDALIDAAQAGKQVVVLVEITARFDEQANIQLGTCAGEGGLPRRVRAGRAQDALQDLPGRAAGEGPPAPLRAPGHRQLQPEDRAHLRGPGAAHRRPGGRRRPHRPVQHADRLQPADASTARSWSRRTACAPGSSSASSARRSTPAPAGRRGVVLKANSVVDEQVIDALYRASRAGVPVDLVVRGICALRPGVPGLSETVRVRSVVGRFLEHSRVMVFGHRDREQDPREHWMGSADLMHRNLDRRVETLVRVKDAAVVGQLDHLLERLLAPEIVRWELQPDGCWHRFPEDGSPGVDVQSELVRRAGERAHG